MKGSQHTICYHVDNVILSHLKPKVNDEFAKWANKVYGTLKKVEVHQGKVHEYLGMQLDFQKEKGKVHVSQEEHVKDIIESWPKNLNPSEVAKIPAASDLFERGGGGLLSREYREIFHTIVMKALFVAK